jgi:hypothetical protein
LGLTTEILFILVLGLLVLGPKQLHALLGQVARAKAQFAEASRGFKSRLACRGLPERIVNVTMPLYLVPNGNSALRAITEVPAQIIIAAAARTG